MNHPLRVACLLAALGCSGCGEGEITPAEVTADERQALVDAERQVAAEEAAARRAGR